MRGEEIPNQHVLLPPVGLQVRESTDFYAVEDELVAEALSFIAANCHKPLDLIDVANAMAVGETTIKKKFKKVLGKGVAGQIREIRLERAKREIAQSDRSFAEIARAVGFDNYIRLYNIFRREVGMTPSEYREQQQGNP